MDVWFDNDFDGDFFEKENAALEQIIPKLKATPQPAEPEHKPCQCKQCRARVTDLDDVKAPDIMEDREV